MIHPAIQAANELLENPLSLIAIAIGISIAYMLVQQIMRSIQSAFKDEAIQTSKFQSDSIEILFRLLENGTLKIASSEDEPEKRKRYEDDYVVGDDGELIEIIDDKPKRGESYDG